MPSRKSPAEDLRLFYVQRPPPPLPGITGAQTYFPSLEVLFPSLVDQAGGSPTLAASELLVDISGDMATVEDMMAHTTRQTPIWIRSMHLVEPVSVMSHEYVLPADGALPASRGPWQRALHKLNDPHNEAYTDAIMSCMASRLVETKRSPHFCRFFGTFNGRIPEYRYNITDDMNDIQDEPWYGEGLRSGAFKILAVDPWDPTICAEVTQPWEDPRPMLDAIADAQSESPDDDTNIVSSDDESEDDESDDEISEDSESTSGSELVETDIPVSDGPVEVVNPRVQLRRMDHSSSGSSGDGSGTEDDELEFRAILPNFPAQLTIIERGDGTMDALMDEEADPNASPDMRQTMEQRWAAWLFQVIAGLTVAQSAYDFVHNDLHAGNVLWCGTGETHLYYQIQGAPGGDRFYRVPTFGRIMKIIDFGRATFRPPAAANKNRLWISDAYAPDADAGGQYNCGPYFRQGEPKVLPNRSFDLCRLAVALLETLWPDPPAAVEPRRVLTREPGRTTPETVSPLWNLLWLWLTDRNGKNILLSPDGSERYPDFDLYRAIARDAQNAVPAQQLTLPLFDEAYRCRRKDIPADAQIWRLHAASKHTSTQ